MVLSTVSGIQLGSSNVSPIHGGDYCSLYFWHRCNLIRCDFIPNREMIFIYLFIYLDGEGSSFIRRSKKLKYIESSYPLGVCILCGFITRSCWMGGVISELGGGSWGTADFEYLVDLSSRVIKENIKKHFKNFQYFEKFFWKLF